MELALVVDMRPSAAYWRLLRAGIHVREGDSVDLQSRLWAVRIYYDDPIFIVVGVERTLRLLVVWRTLTDASGLITAIATKRSVGAWAPWLGVFLCADLGVVIVPKPMLLWASSRILAYL